MISNIECILFGISLKYYFILIIYILQRDGTDVFNFVDGYRSWDDYLQSMEQDGTWGDHVILCAAASCFKTCIRVVSSLPNCDDLIIRPDLHDGGMPLVLGHVHEIHYVSLVEVGRDV